MDTLEQRVERLERSCWRWRAGALLLAAVAVGCAATKAEPSGDAQFDHLTVQSLAIRSAPGGAFLYASADKDRASIRLSNPASKTLVSLSADADAAHLLVSRNTHKGMNSAGLIVDDQSGFLDLHENTGKSKEVEPE